MTSDKSTPKNDATPKPASNLGEAASKPEGTAPSNYSRGENQKPVTDSYKDNWNAIYGKKKPKRRK